MLFNSYEFLLAFLPVTAAVFFALGTHGWIRASIAWLVFASLVYYAWWNPIYLAERGFMGSFGTWFPEPCRRYSFESQSGQSAFDAYRQLLVLAHERKVALHLLTSPAHAHLFESMRVVGLWDTFETWKRRLAAINEEVARQLGVEPFPLFDFAVFDPATTEESVPPASSTETMRFYWETSHYTPALGEHVLDRVLGTTPPSEVAPGGFGVALTSASMQEHLVAVREAEGRYREAHPTDVAVLERIAAETADWRAGGTCGPRL